MDIGIHIASFTWPDDQPIALRLAETAAAAEDIGCGAVTVMDHFFQLDMIGGPTQPMLEGYTVLGYLAGVTSTIQLHLLVGGVTYRYPGVLAKTVTTLDVVSNGRAGFGIGAAWHDREHHGLGIPFPSTSERFERLEECLQIVKQVWSDNNGSYEGEHYQLAETLDVPGPIQQPHPPIMVGGGGEKKTLRLVAQYADACNLPAGPMMGVGPDVISHKLDVLRNHCENVGTDYERISKTIMYAGPTDGLVEAMKPYADLGVDRVYLIPVVPDPVGYVGALEPAAAGLADL